MRRQPLGRGDGFRNRRATTRSPDKRRREHARTLRRRPAAGRRVRTLTARRLLDR